MMEINEKIIRHIVDNFYKDLNSYSNVMYINDKGEEMLKGYYFDNYPSILIFLSYYNLFTNSQIATPLIKKYLNYLVSSLKKQKRVILSFAYGLTGVLLALKVVNKIGKVNINLTELQNNYEDLVRLRLEIINRKIKKGTIKSLDYDFINGLSANLLTLLLFSNNKFLIRKCVRYLCDCLDSVLTKTIINLGVAHGIGGIMLVLVQASKNEYLDKCHRLKVERSLKQISEIYIKIYITKKEGKQKLINPWEDRINIKNINPNSLKRRQSWCYGTPGIAYGLLEVAKQLNDTYLEKIVSNIFNKINTIDLIDTELETPTFCHGISGLLSILLNLKDNNRINVNLIKRNLAIELLNKYDSSREFGFRDYDFVSRGKKYENKKEFLDLGLLNGATGCFLSLMSLIDERILSWTKIFLL